MNIENNEQLFNVLIQKNVNNYIETKKDLKYLSWSYAWQEFLKVCPNATYEIKKFTNALTGRTTSYLEDEDFGIMVYTSITAMGTTREMWLPVMDNNNKAMRRQAYTYSTKSGERTVEAVSMFDINKAIMRCLAKNIAMFGLGLYIYNGEDLPTEIDEPITAEQIKRIEELNVRVENVLKRYKVTSLNELTTKQADFIITAKQKALAMEKGE